MRSWYGGSRNKTTSRRYTVHPDRIIVTRADLRRHSMTRFMLMLTAAAVCGPLAANAAAMPATSASINADAADVPAQITRLNQQVLALNNEVHNLGTQFVTGTGNTPELVGIIPTGG